MKIYIYGVKRDGTFNCNEEEVTETKALYKSIDGNSMHSCSLSQLKKADEGVASTVFIETYVYLTSKDDERAKKILHNFYMKQYEEKLSQANQLKSIADKLFKED